MKTTKKILAMILAMFMMLGMVTSVSAATITIEGGASGSEYSAYQLMTAVALNDGSGKYNFTVNSKYKAVLEEIIKEVTETTETTNDDIVEYISKLSAADTRIFADAVYAKIQADNSLTPDAKAKEGTNKFENVEKGYYLIAETKLGTTDTDKTDTYSLVMLNTAGVKDITVTTKEDVPTVDKQVEEKNDTTGQEDDWGKSADYDIGDTINYKITGTVSSKYADYKSYYYSFSDKMDEGLSLLPSEEDSDDYADSIKIMIGTVDVTEQFDITATEHSFTATANLKKLTGVTITGETKIVVTYTAVLNENAVSGTDGNKNRIILEYENNPYHEGDGKNYNKPDEPGKTPEDVNIVFTFDAIVNKTDDKGKALKGAGFTLYKKYPADTEGVDKDGYKPVGEEISGGDITTFRFEGLDAGEYKLVETKVPKGHNKAEDIIFTVEADYDTDKDPVVLKGLVVKDAEGKTISSTDSSKTDAQFFVTLSSGEMSTTVINKAGMELPSTGGMGTTIFYVIGGILVVGAAVLLITKRRMRSE